MKLYINNEWQIIANTQELRDMLKAVQEQVWQYEDCQEAPEYKRMKQLEKDLYKILEVIPWE